MMPIEFPPGVTNLESKNAKILNWREAHLIRWDNGTTLRPVGGWERLSLGPFASKVRKMHRWISNVNLTYQAYLCERHCYVEEIGSGTVVDITPVDGMIGPPTTDAGGYGDNLYSAFKYGTPRPGPSKLNFYTPVYSLDNWGQELRAMNSSDGRYLGWSPASPAGTKLTAVTDAPIGNRSFIITPERHAMLFGMGGDFAKFGWSDEEDDTDWEFSDILSRANFYDVSPKSTIITHQLFDVGILMFTTSMAYVIEWMGLPYVYTYRPIGKASVPISPASICETPAGIMWPAVDGWWIFDGTAPRIMGSAVWDYVDRHLNLSRSRFTATCIHLSNKGEVWWFFSDKTATADDNNRYITYDYRSLVWSTGKLNRSCGFVYANDVNATMSDGVSIFRHEQGFSYPGAEMPWIESQNLTPDGGEHMLTVNKILPDISGDADAIRFRMAKTNDRAGYTPETYSPQRKKNGSGYVDIRETARDMRLRVDMVKNVDWGTVGPILFDNRQRGKK